MALALYRKYRPRTFAEVIGQEHVTEPLMQALRTGRLNHAYLFSGPRGCGKTSSARILARSLNCEKGPTPEPCGECDSCLALAPDGAGSIDVIEIDAASHGGVDDARDLRERAFFAPVASRFKVYIIDEAHMVSTQGFNALLKLVEEPPEYVKFVFATTEPEKVLGTIRSRTHHYPFRLITPNVLRPYLEKLCQQEGVSVDPAVFPLVVRAGGGSARDSLSVLDQLIAGAGVYGVTYSRAVALLGVTDVALIDEMADALAAGDGAAAFAAIDRVADAGHDPRRFTGDLLERLRDLIVLQKVPDATGSGIIEAPSDQLERMAAQSTRFGPATLSRLADIAHNGLTEMRGTTAPRLLLELVVARMLLPGAEESHGALLQRLERMERRLGASEPSTMGSDLEHGGSPSVPQIRSVPPAAAPPPSVPRAASVPASPSVPTAPSVPAPPVRTQAAPDRGGQPVDASTSATTVGQAGPASADHIAGPTDGAGTVDAAGSLDAAAVRRVWDEVLSVVRRRSPRAWAVVREAMVRDVHADEIVLVFQHAVHANMFGAQADLLVDAVREVLGGTWRVRAELGSDDGARTAGRATDSGRDTPAPSPAASRPAPSKPPAQARNASRATSPSSTATPAPASVGEDGWPTPATLGGEPTGASAPEVAANSDPAAGASSRLPAGAAVLGGQVAGGSTSAGEPGGGEPDGGGPGGGGLGGGSGGGGSGGFGAAGSPAGATSPAGSGSASGSGASPRASGLGAATASAAKTNASAASGSTPGASATNAAGRGGSASGRAGAPAARGAAAGGRAAARGGAGAARSGKPARSGGFGDEPPADEPPFDPDYDSVPPSKAAYEGFDPGDEPLDDASTVRETSEEQAIRVLTEHFGAEKISGEAKQQR